ncbi:LysR family transcriptional regulator [Pseudarthrobacter sulfonivorans]|uniref:LysR family transcriptional regulator n=1 Tax=Pseudarthrobacter sulfonivorans TaxID=121292 RepID=UPI0028601C85|nr:LysR family transcriptional regulator [Pseudarthrobacter sulfonivorans]MDR6416446.1 DNA-binding transcriptional LysR family regulator [Pseudarthrobacter sulfonivorans]
MHLKYLRAFAVLAEELHFGRAAERLAVAQPQLSVWIRRLEQELGVVLFDRTSRSVRLTDAGHAVHGPILKTLESASLIERAAMLGSSAVVGQVVVGYAGASSRDVVPPLAKAVRAAEPGIELKLKSLVYGGLAPADVASGAIDIGFARLPVRDKDVRVRVFTYERIMVALPEDHLLASAASIQLRDLAREPFVAFPATIGSNLRDATTRLALEVGFSPHVMQEAPDSYAVLSLVAAGVGVTLTLSSVQHINPPGLVFRELAGPPVHLAVAVVWRGQGVGRATQAVLDIFEQIMPTPPVPAGRILD